ncbi:MAG: hypothetical protein FJX74_06325 [Armatimonadetes bacterium]|nr:hypothetical protein [Armatimonadota bacterium]
MGRPRHWVRVAVALCALPVVLLGCQKDEVARVNGVVVKRAELMTELEKRWGGPMLQGMINQMIIRQAFDRSGLQFPQDKLEKVIQEEREMAGSEEAFQMRLAYAGQDEELHRTQLELDMKLTMLAQKDVVVTEEALREYYKENEPRYREPERVSFSEIVLPTKQQAEDVRKLAAKPNASFADLAKQYSIASSQQMGGRRATMAVEDIVPAEIRDPLLKLKPNAVSEPIQAGGAWAILQLHERLPAKQLTFEEAREQVEAGYKAEKQPVPTNELAQQLLNQASVQVVDPKYAELQRQYMSADLLRAAPGGEGAVAPKGPPGAETPKTGAPAGAAPTEAPPATPKGETK